MTSILPERFSSTSMPKSYTREIPLGFNGYAVVAQPAMHVHAEDVQVGDILLLDGYVSRVSEVQQVLASSMSALHIKGDLNVIRFPHEMLSVIRSA